PSLAQVATRVPVAPDSTSQAQPNFRLAGIACPAQGGAQVPTLVVESLEPFSLPRARQLRLSPLGQRQIVTGVRPAQRDCLPRRDQLLQAELADRLQHRVAWLAPRSRLLLA